MVVQTSIPLLENGDRLSRSEFERRYLAMPNHQKAELIEGAVYMASPLRFNRHAKPHGALITWLGVYQIATPGVSLGIEPTILLDLDNELQPDGVLLLDVGGGAHITEDDYIEGAPELVIEIAASSAGYDLHDKKRVYRRNGVREYLVWQQHENQLDWFFLDLDQYVTREVDERGIVRSHIFPGLWLAVEALLTGEMNQVLTVLQEGINSPEHNNFVQILAERNSAK